MRRIDERKICGYGDQKSFRKLRMSVQLEQGGDEGERGGERARSWRGPGGDAAAAAADAGPSSVDRREISWGVTVPATRLYQR